MTDKLAGIKPGDRVRISFEIEVKYNDLQRLEGVTDDDSIISVPNHSTLQIERIEPPLKVGGKVYWEYRKGDVMTIVALADKQAWCVDEEGDYCTYDKVELERIA